MPHDAGRHHGRHLRVPDGATCILKGTNVKGTIKVETGATLKAYGVRVIGNVQGENAARVVIKAGSRVGGSFQVVQSRVAKVLDSRINGSILVDDNRGLNVIRRNVVGEDVQAFQNTGGVEIYVQAFQNAPGRAGRASFSWLFPGGPDGGSTRPAVSRVSWSSWAGARPRSRAIAESSRPPIRAPCASRAE